MYCRKQLFTACDVTNPHTEGVSFTNIQEALYGHRTGAHACELELRASLAECTRCSRVVTVIRTWQRLQRTTRKKRHSCHASACWRVPHQ